MWRISVEERNISCNTKTAAFGGGPVMVWECIKNDGKRKLLKVYGNLNSENYMSFLRFNHVRIKRWRIFFSMNVHQAIYHEQQKGPLWMKIFSFGRRVSKTIWFQCNHFVENWWNKYSIKNHTISKSFADKEYEKKFQWKNLDHVLFNIASNWGNYSG